MTGLRPDGSAGDPGSIDPNAIWRGLAGRAGLPRAAAENFRREIETAYASPGRHYHTMDHIRRMLADWRRLCGGFARPDDAAMAIFCHDIVYRVPGESNEAESALLARERLASCRSGSVDSDRVAEMIRATSGHIPTGNADTDLFIDMDLAILASSSEEYERYAEGVRKEHGMIDEETYRIGRLRFLESFLARPFIFASPAGRRTWEKRARRNLIAERERLSSR